MYRRKLTALGYVEASTFAIHNEKDLRNLVVWLEDLKIRHYKIEQRTELRLIEGKNWPKAYKQYLSDLACPIESGKTNEELEWLLTFAVALEYEDNLDKYNKSIPQATAAPTTTSENPLDNLDFQSADFVQGVNRLAALFKIDQQPNHLITLKAIARIVSTRLTEKALKDPNSVMSKGEPFPFEEADSGFSLGDPVLNKAAKILRLLYIHDLRQLQTYINECIVAVQNITANPKTDTKLGQVGR